MIYTTVTVHMIQIHKMLLPGARNTCFMYCLHSKEIKFKKKKEKKITHHMFITQYAKNLIISQPGTVTDRKYKCLI